MQGPDCLNCGAPLSGRFCAACGQKRIEPEERKLSWFFRALLESAVGADGRLRRTVSSFLLRPGELGAAWLAGQRTRYLPPLGMFLLVNLVYFLAPPLSDFNLSLAEQWIQWYGGWARELVDARLAARGIELADYAHRFQLEAYSLAKLIVVLHPLLMAPVLALLFWRRRIPLVDHLAVALHLWAMVILAMMVVPPLVGGIGEALGASQDAVRIAFKGTLLGVVGYYSAMTLRRAYGMPRLWLVPGAITVYVGGAIGHLCVYRPVLFYLAYGLS